MNEEDMQQRNEQGQYYHTKSVKKINSIEKDRSIEYHELPVPTLAENRIAQGAAEVGSLLAIVIVGSLLVSILVELVILLYNSI